MNVSRHPGFRSLRLPLAGLPVPPPGRRIPIVAGSPVEFLVRLREVRRRSRRNWSRS
jgi:hypothetical protein